MTAASSHFRGLCVFITQKKHGTACSGRSSPWAKRGGGGERREEGGGRREEGLFYLSCQLFFLLSFHNNFLHQPKFRLAQINLKEFSNTTCNEDPLLLPHS